MEIICEYCNLPKVVRVKSKSTSHFRFWSSRDSLVLNNFSFWYSRHSLVLSHFSSWYYRDSRALSHLSFWCSGTREQWVISVFGTPETREYSVISAILQGLSHSKWLALASHWVPVAVTGTTFEIMIIFPYERACCYRLMNVLYHVQYVVGMCYEKHA